MICKGQHCQGINFENAELPLNCSSLTVSVTRENTASWLEKRVALCDQVSLHVRSGFSRSPMSSRRRHVGTRENPPESTCLGVFGLSLYTTERDLEKEFGRFGPLQKVQIVLDGKVSIERIHDR